MRITLTHREEKAGLFGTKKVHFIEAHIELTEDEEDVVRAQKLGAYHFITAGFSGAIYWYATHPYSRLRDRHAALTLRVRDLSFPTVPSFLEAFGGRYIERLKADSLLPPSDELFESLLGRVGSLYDQEDFPARFELPPAPEFQWRPRPDYRRLERRLTELETALDQFADLQIEFTEICIEALVLFTAALPAPALQTWDEFHGETEEPVHFITVPACDMMKNVPDLVDKLTSLFAAPVARSREIFERFIATYQNAVEEVSAKLLTQTQLKQEEYVFPEQYQGTAAETVKAYLAAHPGTSRSQPPFHLPSTTFAFGTNGSSRRPAAARRSFSRPKSQPISPRLHAVRPASLSWIARAQNRARLLATPSG